MSDGISLPGLATTIGLIGSTDNDDAVNNLVISVPYRWQRRAFLAYVFKV